MRVVPAFMSNKFPEEGTSVQATVTVTHIGQNVALQISAFTSVPFLLGVQS